MSNCISLVQKAFIINQHWQTMLVKHPLSDTSAPLWDLPGDGLNFTESLRDNLIKNVSVTTGFTITTVSIPLNVTTFLDITNRQNQVVRIIYLCIAQGSPLPGTDLIWIDPEQYIHYSFPDEGYPTAFKNYLSHSRLASEEFLDRGILEHTADFLRQKPFNPDLPLS